MRNRLTQRGTFYQTRVKALGRISSWGPRKSWFPWNTTCSASQGTVSLPRSASRKQPGHAGWMFCSRPLWQPAELCEAHDKRKGRRDKLRTACHPWVEQDDAGRFVCGQCSLINGKNCSSVITGPTWRQVLQAGPWWPPINEQSFIPAAAQEATGSVTASRIFTIPRARVGLPSD